MAQIWGPVQEQASFGTDLRLTRLSLKTCCRASAPRPRADPVAAIHITGLRRDAAGFGINTDMSAFTQLQANGEWPLAGSLSTWAGKG